MSIFQTVDPTRYYEVGGQAYPVLSAASEFAVAANQQVIAGVPASAGVSAKKIRVMGLWISGRAVGFPTYAFKSASGGTILTPTLYCPNNAAGLITQYPLSTVGYFETIAGEGLFVDVGVAIISIFTNYIIYAP